MKGSIYFINVILFLLLLMTQSCCLAKNNEMIVIKVGKTNENKNVKKIIKKSMKPDFLGTNLYFNYGDPNKKCFTVHEIALIAARRESERLVPREFTNYPLDDRLVEVLIQYFYGASQIIIEMTEKCNRIYLQTALFDTLGGYLYHYLIPISKTSFYAGTVSLNTILNLNELLEQCKIYLNTNGNGWQCPIKISIDDYQIEPLCIQHNKNRCQSCTNLNLINERVGNDCGMIVELPKLESSDCKKLSNIWLPFRSKRIYNLRSNLAAFILLRYFITVSECYKFQGLSQEKFNRKFRNWLQQKIVPHLSDAILYPGLGGVLRILETLKNPVTARNINKNDDKRQSLTQKGENKPIANLKTDEKSSFFEKIFGFKKDSKDVKVAKAKTADFVNYEDDDSDDDSDDDNNTGGASSRCIKAKRSMYTMIAIIVSVIIVIFIFIVAVITKYMADGQCCKRTNAKKSSLAKNNKLTQECLLPITEIQSRTSSKHSSKHTSKHSSKHSSKPCSKSPSRLSSTNASVKNCCFRSHKSKPKKSPRKPCNIPCGSPREIKKHSMLLTKCKHLLHRSKSKEHLLEHAKDQIACSISRLSHLNKDCLKSHSSKPSRNSSSHHLHNVCSISQHTPRSSRKSSSHHVNKDCQKSPKSSRNSSTHKMGRKQHTPRILKDHPTPSLLRRSSDKCTNKRSPKPRKKRKDTSPINKVKKLVRDYLSPRRHPSVLNHHCPKKHFRAGEDREEIILQRNIFNNSSSQNSLTSIISEKQMTEIQPSNSGVYKTFNKTGKQILLSSSESLSSLRKTEISSTVNKRQLSQTNSSLTKKESIQQSKQSFSMVNEKLKQPPSSKKKSDISKIPIKKPSAIPQLRGTNLLKKNINEKPKVELNLSPKIPTNVDAHASSSWETFNDH